MVLGGLLAIPSLCFATESAQTRAMVRHYAAHYNVPQELISALIDVESAWNQRAISNKGAVGLMQLMPETARHLAPAILSIRNRTSLQALAMSPR
jgi:soluble lytic murein transglycosylase-like protein